MTWVLQPVTSVYEETADVLLNEFYGRRLPGPHRTDASQPAEEVGGVATLQSKAESVQPRFNRRRAKCTAGFLSLNADGVNVSRHQENRNTQSIIPDGDVRWMRIASYNTT